MIEIEQADGGYILKTHSIKKVFSNFNDLVQWLAGYFGEVEIGENREPIAGGGSNG